MRCFPAVNLLWTLLVVAVLGLLTWVGFRMEPHWVAKDGKAFTCRIQSISSRGDSDGRWRDARAFIDDDGGVVVRPRGAMNRIRLASSYRVMRRAETPPKGRVVYLLDGSDSDLLALRIPTSSRAIAHLDPLMPR